MRIVEFRLALGSASICEQMEFLDTNTDEQIQESLDNWKEDNIEYAWYPVEEEE